MITINDKEKCCGCESCKQICPTKCIQMRSDKEGFLYPQIDESKCISCGLCDKTCPEKLQKEELVGTYETKAYGGKHIDNELLKESSSGGAFSLFANHILKHGGIVFGCTLDKEMHARHVGVENISELGKLRGSKYLQSEIGETYVEVKKAVEEGRKVLFVGTPCQTAGLYSFIGKKKYDNLWMMDFICHGVPSPKIFEEYVRAEETRNKGKIISYRFRNKDHGWSQTGLQLGTWSKFSNGKEVRRYPALRDPYMNGFLADLYLRPSCYNCNFKQIAKEYADITIGDFWGVNKIAKELNDNKGTSLILIHSEKGNALWRRVNSQFIFKEIDCNAVIKYNPPIINSSKRNARRDLFFQNYYVKGYKYVMRRYMTAFSWVCNRLKF